MSSMCVCGGVGGGGCVSSVCVCGGGGSGGLLSL